MSDGRERACLRTFCAAKNAVETEITHEWLQRGEGETPDDKDIMFEGLYHHRSYEVCGRW